MNHYSNPTENAAISAVDLEIKMMRNRAEQIKRNRQQGKLTAEELAKAHRQFVGIYARFLREAICSFSDSDHAGAFSATLQEV